MGEKVGAKTLLFMDRTSPGRAVAARFALVSMLVLVVMMIFWIKKGDLLDSYDGDVSDADIVYFTFVTITTVGYGDIVPITEEARLLDAFIVTPVRVIIWFILIGTTYELIVPRYLEQWRLRRMQKKLEGHTIIIGYGTVGKAVVSELMKKGHVKDNIIILDEHAEHVEEAAMDGFTALQGNVTSEALLNKAVITKARALIVATAKDDTNVLVCLTAKDLNPVITVITRVNMAENEKLLKRGGADVVISPSVVGGKLLAAATSMKVGAEVLEDLLTGGEGLDVIQRGPSDAEIGKDVSCVKNGIVLAVRREKRTFLIPKLREIELKRGDELVVIGTNNKRGGK